MLASLTVIASAQQMYVLSVGISDYAEIRDLQKTEQDAKDFAELYATHTQNVTLLLGRQATHDKILSAMRQTFQKAKPEDVVVFFFSGHGSKGGICAYDTKSKNLVTYKEIQDAMKACQAKRKHLFIDACFSGGLRAKSSNSSANVFSNTDIMLFLSSRTNETSIENRWSDNGYYTQYLIKGIKGAADADRNRIITARELYDYVSERVREATADRQHPVMWGKFADNMHIMNWNKKE